MRPDLPFLLLALLLTPPAAVASHPVHIDPAALVKDGGEMVVFVDVNGHVKGSSAVHETTDSDGDVDIHTSDLTWHATYSWSATVFLTARPAPAEGGWTHEGRTLINDSTTFEDRYDSLTRNNVGTEYEWSSTTERTCSASGVDRRSTRVFARVDDTGKIVVRFDGMQWHTTTTVKTQCRQVQKDPSGTTTNEDPRSPGALVHAPVLRDAATQADLVHLDLELEPTRGKQVFVDAYSGKGADPPIRNTRDYAYCWQSDENADRRCTAFGTIEATLFVDPCATIEQSYATHVAAVQALRAPPEGSSEPQVRAFQADVGPKVRALLADSRQLELICGVSRDALTPVSQVSRMLADAWFDVARRSGLSQEGVRDALAAERQAQLTGAEGSNDLSALDASIARNGAPSSSGSATVKVHSPVALRAWDEQGRHTGWNDEKGGPDLEIPNASYAGKAGEAQSLVLPEGVYRISAEELGPGTYALNLSAGNETDVTPLRATAGGASSIVILVDHLGATTIAAARGAIPSGFVAPFEMRSTAPPPSAPAGGAAEDTEAAGEAKGAPFPGLAPLLVALLIAAALPRARRDGS